ncbi:DUF4396 domain-containing protein [Halosegnis marinus]|uniref:DUF4396 domain-containing protein n=1 Tax=Halosegnis marinus TaxID=3034023 RepID=UPI003624381A
MTDPRLLAAWAVVVAASLAVVVYDIRANNVGIAPLMKFVWTLTVLYSGPLGLAVYYYSGRPSIPEDTVWRRGFRSVAHCYSGCGAGEVVGVVVAAGLLDLPTLSVAAVTFACAYLAGFALTVGPLVQEGEDLRTAVADAFYSETPSITVMEVTAIGTDIVVAGEAAITEPLFWSGLVFSLTVGLLVAYPLNVALVHVGVKGGMQDPREAAA